jgi:hypothetical protein
MGERRHANRALVGKTEGRRPLERARRRWKDNIKTDLREVGCGGLVLSFKLHTVYFPGWISQYRGWTTDELFFYSQHERDLCLLQSVQTG